MTSEETVADDDNIVLHNSDVEVHTVSMLSFPFNQIRSF